MTYTKQNGLEKEKLPKLRIVAFFFQESSHQVLPSETQIAFLFEIEQLRWPLWCFCFFYPSQELTATPSNHKIWNAIDIVFLRQVSSIPSAVNGWLIPRIHEGELISPTSLVLFGGVCDCTGISASVTNSLTQSDTLQRFESIRINLTVLQLTQIADKNLVRRRLRDGLWYAMHQRKRLQFSQPTGTTVVSVDTGNHGFLLQRDVNATHEPQWVS